MASVRNSVDDLLILGKDTAQNEHTPPADTTPEPQPKNEPEKDDSFRAVEHTEPEPAIPENEESEENGKDETVTATAEDDTATAETDEYGLPKAKPKTYSEEDVQRMIRERLARANRQHPEQPPQQQHSQQQTATGEEDWQKELSGFVRNELTRVQQEALEQQRAERDRQIQAQFEAKFQSGMSRFPDFVEKVSDKPFTDAMVGATRGLNDPAAFIYAASQKHAGEIERISKIPDAYAQAVEIGRLHERMTSKKRAQPGGHAPIKPASGDINDRDPASKSIDDMIAEYGRERVRR